MNQTLFQFFHWYYSPEGNLWNHVKDQAAYLSSLGITYAWLPPAYKSAQGVNEPGYAVYDLYDLGEFDQKGTVRTRYGTKDEYLEAIRSLQQHGVGVLADVVLNHKTGGDEKEKVMVQGVKDDNRLEKITEPHTVEAHTLFTFPGRQGKYSDYIWDKNSFTGLCEDGTIRVIMNEYSNGEWEEMIEDENGNFDYLMGMDVEFRNPYVREELKKWGCWYGETTGVDGFRLDALKHITPDFFPEWIDHLKHCLNKDFLVVGEYWQSNSEVLTTYIEKTGGRIQLFDVPLHFNFYDASLKGHDYDMRNIFDGTLLQSRPELAITFVDNHDTQPLQSLESVVEFWFKPLAYAIILLREQGIPCVFYPALFEAKYGEKRGDEEIFVELHKVHPVPVMLKIRKELAYGIQRDYFDDPDIVGWTREGRSDKPDSGVVVLMSNGREGEKYMSMGNLNAGRVLIDITGHHPEPVVLNDEGEGMFRVHQQSLSIWVSEGALDKISV